jgi:hypothetical protein
MIGKPLKFAHHQALPGRIKPYSNAPRSSAHWWSEFQNTQEKQNILNMLQGQNLGQEMD